MRTGRLAAASLCALLAIAGLGACSEGGPAERAGRALDDAAEEAADAAEEAKDSIEDAFN